LFSIHLLKLKQWKIRFVSLIPGHLDINLEEGIPEQHLTYLFDEEDGIPKDLDNNYNL